MFSFGTGSVSLFVLIPTQEAKDGQVGSRGEATRPWVLAGEAGGSRVWRLCRIGCRQQRAAKHAPRQGFAPAQRGRTRGRSCGSGLPAPCFGTFWSIWWTSGLAGQTLCWASERGRHYTGQSEWEPGKIGVSAVQ